MREGLFDHHRLDPLTMVAAAVGGAPVAQAFIGPVPQGYAWYVENIGFAVAGDTHTAELDVAVLVDDGASLGTAAWDRAGMVAGSFTAAKRGTIQPGIAIYVPAGHVVRFYAVPGTLANGDAVTVTCQSAVHQLDPHFIMSPDDALQVKSAHERMSAELNQDAVGARAN
jgi:hypothetical protein